MDRSPFDVDALARIANELFRTGDGETGVQAPGPTEIPSATQAGAAAVDAGLGPGTGHLPNVPAGGAAAAPTAPPTRPAYGRPVSAEVPAIGYGTGQPPFGTGLNPDSIGTPLGFDPQAIPGFGLIPHVDETFDVPSIFGIGDAKPVSSTIGPSVPGLDPTGGDLGSYRAAPGSFNVPTESQAYPHSVSSGDAFGLPAGGAAFSPTTPAQQPAFGRPVSAEVPTIGYGSGQPRTGTAPASGATGVPSFDAQDYLGMTGPGTNALPQRLADFGSPGDANPRTFETVTSPYLAPPDVPGRTATLGKPAPYPGPETVPTTLPDTAAARNIDRPTPNAFQFTDAPHLGEFDEEKILKTALDPRNGAPAVEGLVDRATPLPDAYAGGLAPTAQPSFYFIDDRMDYFADDVPDVPRPTATPFNAEAVRADFPVLRQHVNGHPLVWLDNGATTQKPQSVIDRVARFYENENSNISRSAHSLAAAATNSYEDARKTVQRFINAPTADEIVFVRGTTEGINFVAQSYGRRFIKMGDEIVLTHGEHHANIVPWYLLAKEVGATLRVVPFDDTGEIMLDEYERLLNDRVKIVATTHVANALGTILPVKAMTEIAHRHGIPVLVDGAQSISHMPIDVQDIGCDFFIFSGHKVFAPTGIGAVFGKKALLDQMPPWQGGGNMIQDVTFERITFQPAPGRFEAGTGNIADALGLAEALKYLERLGMTNIEQYEHVLLDYATQKLAPIKGLKIIGNAREKAGVISFVLEGKEPQEVGKELDQKGIAVRAGHHCALPILRRYGVEATIRPAFAMYNTFEDADRLADAVREIAGR